MRFESVKVRVIGLCECGWVRVRMVRECLSEGEGWCDCGWVKVSDVWGMVG
jgi:hypothetical protein